MRKVMLLCACTLALLITGVQADVANLIAIEDTYVDSVASATNFGNGEYLNIQGYDDTVIWANESIQRTFLKFDLASVIPSNAVITGAVFGIYFAGQNTGGYSTSDPAAFLYYVGDDSWSENSMNWNTKPTNVSSNSIQGNPTSFSSVDTAYEWDLFSGSGFEWTNWSQDLADGRISFMMTVESEGMNNYANIYSSEFGNANMRPYLNVTYSVVPEPTSMAITLIGIGSWMAAKRRKNSI